MGKPKTPKVEPVKPAPEPPKVDAGLDDPDAVNAARDRLEKERARRGRASMIIPLSVGGTAGQTGVAVR